MHNTLTYVTFGWLAFSGTLHFLIDVVSQYVRHKRAPGTEATLYYGLHTSYALSQVLFGIFALMLARRVPGMLDEWPALALTGFAIIAWLTIGFLFIEYREPKIMVGIFAALAIAMVVTR